MPHRPALLHRTLGTAAALLALLAAGSAAAPAAWAAVDPSAPAPDQQGTSADPVAFGAGELRLFVGEEQGNELGGDVDLGGATILVTFLGPEDDEESYACTTDAIGRCRFTDGGEEFALGLVPGDEVVVEQLSAPSSGLFDLPADEDAVLHAVVPDDSPGIPADRTTPVQAPSSPGAASSDLVDRMAPDVLSKPGTWTQVVFYDPLATAPDDTDSGTSGPAGTSPDGTAPGSSSAGDTSASTPAAGSAPAVTTSGATTAAAAATTISGPAVPATTASGTPTAPDGSPLATTGADVLPVLGLGGALLVAGTGGLLAAHRRTAR